MAIASSTNSTRGEPIRGERAVIEEQAEIVRRIFREYVAGKGRQRIAADLNRDGIPSPTGKRWGDTTIRGNREIGSGILNCELYMGKLVWNRQRKLKNPDTGRYAYRLNPQSAWINAEAPELRIVPQELWDAAKARQAHLSDVFASQIEGTRTAMRHLMAKNGGLNARHRSRTLLSGLLFCGLFGGTYRMRGHDRYVCTNHALGNGCGNSRTLTREVLETRVLTGLRDRLMTPDMAAEAMTSAAKLHITLQGEFGTILDWIERSGKPGYHPDPDTATSRLSSSVKTRAGPGEDLCSRSRSGFTGLKTCDVRFTEAYVTKPVYHPRR